MKKIVYVFITFSMLVACSPMETRNTGQQDISDADQIETPDTTRTLEIGGKTLDIYAHWACRDYASDGPTVLELVITNITFGDMINEVIQEDEYIKKEMQKSKDISKTLQELKAAQKFNVGYILFDDGKEYEAALHRREGINHRWVWEEGNYSFIIKPDGTGLYYDFTNAKDGTTKARDVFKCEKYHQ